MKILITLIEEEKSINELFTSFFTPFQDDIEVQYHSFNTAMAHLSPEVEKSDWIILTTSDYKLAQTQLASFKKGEVFLAPSIPSGENHWAPWTQLIKNNPQIVGIINRRDSLDCYLSWIRTLIQQKKYIYNWSLKLKNLLENSTSDLQKAKKHVRERLPLRYGRYGTLEMVGQFRPGEGPGGEFFDTIENQGQVGILLTTSSSYELNSHLLLSYSELKLETHLTLESLEQFLFHIYQTYPKAVQQLQILLGLLQLDSYTFEGYNIGGTKLLTQDGDISIINDPDRALPYFKCNLRETPHLLIFSPGVQKNSASIPNFPFGEGTPEHFFAQNRQDILDNTLFLMQKELKTKNFRHDVTTLILGKV